MASTALKRQWWADWRCDTLKMTRVGFPGIDRTWNLYVADASKPAWEVFAGLMQKHGYLFRESAGGTYNCRFIAGTNNYSLHAYGLALDLNPSVNRSGQTNHDYPQGFIDDVLATGLFRWGVVFGVPDPMHWEIDVPPSEIGDPLMLTADQQEKLAQFVDALDALGSSPKFVNYLIPDMRKNLVTFDELKAALEGIQSGTVDETARQLAEEANAKLAAIRDAI